MTDTYDFPPLLKGRPRSIIHSAFDATRSDVVDNGRIRRALPNGKRLSCQGGPLTAQELADIHGSWQRWDAGTPAPHRHRFEVANHLTAMVETADFLLCRVPGYPQGDVLRVAHEIAGSGMATVDSGGVRRAVWAAVLAVVNKWVPPPGVGAAETKQAA